MLLDQVDMFVLRTFEAGLILFWQNEAATQYMDQNVQKAIRYRQKVHEIVQLKLLHVQGAFGILIFGCLIASLVFLFELTYKKLSKISISLK